jgi:hypothetical protein
VRDVPARAQRSVLGQDGLDPEEDHRGPPVAAGRGLEREGHAAVAAQAGIQDLQDFHAAARLRNSHHGARGD